MLPLPASDRHQFTLLTVEIKYHIWIAHCVVIRGGHAHSILEVMNSMRAGIRKTLYGERQVLRAVSFGRRWLTSSVLFRTAMAGTLFTSKAYVPLLSYVQISVSVCCRVACSTYINPRHAIKPVFGCQY